jgi:hypothetical protein
MRACCALQPHHRAGAAPAERVGVADVAGGHGGGAVADLAHDGVQLGAGDGGQGRLARR